MYRLADGHENLPFREFANGRDGDRRLLPRIGGKPLDLESVAYKVLVMLGGAASVDEIIEAAIPVVLQMRYEAEGPSL